MLPVRPFAIITLMTTQTANSNIFTQIDKDQQKRWSDAKLFRTPANPVSGKKFYCLDMFPYPSGAGLHVGHPEGYTASDIITRYKRMNGFSVLHPMGWDAFGLPAENYAIATGIHPEKTTLKNIDTYRRQIQSIGLCYDWEREVNTTAPEYFKWTQWIFLQLFKRGLAYESTVPINWCPACKTGLANEEVFGGKCERCGTAIEEKDLRQWMLRITAYGPQLLDGLEGLDWPESTMHMQKNWIGRSDGAEVTFKVDGLTDTITVFTTRPDTLYGATYMVLAPEHPLVDTIYRAKKPASLPARTRLTRLTARKSQCGFRTMCLRVTAQAQLWRCPRTTSATMRSQKSSIWKLLKWSARKAPLNPVVFPVTA